MRISSQMGVHSCVIRTSMRKSEWITSNTSRDISLLSSMSKVSIPLLMPRSKVLNLSKNKTKRLITYFISQKEREITRYSVTDNPQRISQILAYILSINRVEKNSDQFYIYISISILICITAYYYNINIATTPASSVTIPTTTDSYHLQSTYYM